MSSSSSAPVHGQVCALPRGTGQGRDGRTKFLSAGRRAVDGTRRAGPPGSADRPDAIAWDGHRPNRGVIVAETPVPVESTDTEPQATGRSDQLVSDTGNG